jgi:hypothetical protein
MASGWPEGEVWSCRPFLWDVGRVHAEYHSQSRPSFEPTTAANERSQTHALDRAATGTACISITEMTQFRPLTQLVHYRFKYLKKKGAL